MTDDTHKLQKIIDYCNAKWVAADRPPDATFPTPDVLAGKKIAYNDVLQFARKLFIETP